MHEFSIATRILDDVLAFVDEHEGAEILQIRLEIGELMCVEAEQLRFCFDSIKQLTPLQNASLAIEFVPAVVQCRHCDYRGRPKYWEGALAQAVIATLQCPQCGKSAEAIEGHDCAIRSVQMSAPEERPENIGDTTYTNHEYNPLHHTLPAEL
jgi:hydrogenase nickel incorporation protein HypA/HybF